MVGLGEIIFICNTCYDYVFTSHYNKDIVIVIVIVFRNDTRLS